MDLATRKMVYYGLLGLLIAGSTVAIVRMAPQVVPVQFLAKDGTFTVYFDSIASDIQRDQGMSSQTSTSLLPVLVPPVSITITSLKVTIDSVTIHKSGSGDTDSIQISKSSVTIDLLQQSSIPVLLASDKVPSENVTMVELHVSNATATVKDALGLISFKTVLVSSETLKIPLDSGAIVKPQMSTSLVAARPHIVVEGNGTIRLTPVLNVDRISGPD